MKRWIKREYIIWVLVLLLGAGTAFAQKPYRAGTTAANFLEIGFGSAGSAMGDAYVASARDISALYWNPAGLAFMQQNEAQFFYQPWLVDMNTAFAAAGLALQGIGNISFGVFHMGYGNMDVTTLEMQEGTGETFNANDYAFSLAYSRLLTPNFGFGAAAKYITSQIWHTSASAIALDLGVTVSTGFFSPSGKNEDGLSIGMSISNYGTKMRYDGIDLLNPIDVSPVENGNYKDVPGQYRLSEWELPLIFRVGVSLNPVVLGPHRITVAGDALHPNNNSESVNVGMQYEYKLAGSGSFFLRGGYKGLFMVDSQYGYSFGAGATLRMMGNLGLKIEYGFRDIGILGNVQSYGIGFLF